MEQPVECPDHDLARLAHRHSRGVASAGHVGSRRLVFIAMTAAGNRAPTAEVDQMKICDVCKHVVDRLQDGPPELPRIEVCGECVADMLRRFALLNQRSEDAKRLMRINELAEWRRDRAPKESVATK